MDGDRKVGAVAGGLKLPACAELRNYKGTLEAFEGGARTQVVGQLSLNSVTRPLNPKINFFKCILHPMRKRELCGKKMWPDPRVALHLNQLKRHSARCRVEFH